MGPRRKGGWHQGAVTWCLTRRPRSSQTTTEEATMPRIHALLLKSAGILLALTATAAAQQYPVKAVRLIVPLPPGGFNDIVARIVGTQLTERLGRQVVVDNRTGAGGVVGTEQGAHAPNDGYTLTIASLALTINPWFHKVSYDSAKSFAPVAILATAPN